MRLGRVCTLKEFQVKGGKWELKSTPWSRHQVNVVWGCIYLKGHLFLTYTKVLLCGLAVTLNSCKVGV